MTKKWGKGHLYTCRNCGFQYVRLRGVSTNGETENVMAIKSVFSSDFDECYVEYGEMYSLHNTTVPLKWTNRSLN